MFDLSFAEIVVVCLVAMLVIGPEEIPVVVRQMVKMTRSVRMWFAGVKREVINAVDADGSMQEELQEVQQSLGEGKRFILDESGDYREVYDIQDFLSTDENDSQKSGDA